MTWLTILTELGKSAFKIVTDNLSTSKREKLDADQVAAELEKIRADREELKRRIEEILSR